MLASTQSEPVRSTAVAAAEPAPAGREQRPSWKRIGTFVIAAGGTGGHVLPGLQVARELRRRGHACLFVGTETGQEGRLVPEAGFPIEFVRVGPLKRVSFVRRLRTLLEMPSSLQAASSILERARPSAVLSLGGFASGPLMVMAVANDIPVVIMEPNATPGLANRLAGPVAWWAIVGFPSAERYFRQGRTDVSGIPIREEFFKLAPKEHRPPFTVLITGGSQGSRRLNQAAVEALPIWSERGKLQAVHFLHQTGVADYNEVQSAYESHAAKARVAPFFDDMPRTFEEADLVVCRSGASTVAEVAAAGKASVLVPYPFAADQHQLRNAQALETAGAARVIRDAAWNGSRFVAEVERLMGSSAQLTAMERAARRQARPGAVERAADLLEEASCRSGRLSSPGL